MDSEARKALEARNVSRETLERLEHYANLLKKWNPAINLVSRASLDQLWPRHFLDSVQIFDLCPPDARSWADLGSGGGFPGLVVAILAADLKPDLKVTLVESDVRKAIFLNTVVRETGLQTIVLAERIEAIPPLNCDVLSARALAPLNDLCAYAERHLAPTGVALFPKGAAAETEISAARENWTFDLKKTPSVTESKAVILTVKGIYRV